jgi:hypothetical protein
VEETHRLFVSSMDAVTGGLDREPIQWPSRPRAGDPAREEATPAPEEAPTPDREAPEPPEEATPAPQQGPGFGITITLGDFNALSYGSFEACNVAALSLGDSASSCLASCRCVGTHQDGARGTEESCAVSCQSN